MLQRSVDDFMASRERKQPECLAVKHSGRLRSRLAAVLAACCLLFIAVPAFVGVPTAKTPTTSAAVDFNRDILPVLSSNCFGCHGPDPSKRKAKLRLDRRDDAIEKGAIVPGKPDESEMVTRVDAADPTKIMPPPKSKKTLTAAEKQLLARWIEQGAEYGRPWAFVKAVRHAKPAVRDAALGRSEIDAFILARLEHAGITPSPRASARR